jgi:hypothetical protein
MTQLKAKAWAQHEKIRSNERPWEYLSTLALLLAYASAMISSFVRSPPEPAISLEGVVQLEE